MAEFKTIIESALKLRPVERAQLVEVIIKSLDSPDEEIEKVWTEEALKRYDAYKAGRVKAKDLDEVLKRYQANAL